MPAKKTDPACLLKELRSLRAEMDGRFAALVRETKASHRAHEIRLSRVEQAAERSEAHLRSWVVTGVKLRALKKKMDQEDLAHR
jgi:hypothetical protein